MIKKKVYLADGIKKKGSGKILQVNLKDVSVQGADKFEIKVLIHLAYECETSDICVGRI